MNRITAIEQVTNALRVAGGRATTSDLCAALPQMDRGATLGSLAHLKRKRVVESNYVPTRPPECGWTYWFASTRPVRGSRYRAAVSAGFTRVICEWMDSQGGEASIEAWRAWAVQGPERFMLIFGTPVPGYAAPEGGPTVTANRRMGQVFFTLAALAWREGLIAARPAPRGAQPTPAEAQVHAELVAIAPGFPSALIPVMLSGWALWHGLVTLEITGQLEWIYPDADAYYTDRMTQWLAGFAGNAVEPRPEPDWPGRAARTSTVWTTSQVPKRSSWDSTHPVAPSQ